MTDPQHAIESARAAAASMRESGAYGDDLSGFRIEPADAVTTDKLLEWALIEPDPANVYSTRRLGAPITWVKRLLLRLLHQYFTELAAQQTRFNIQMTVYAGELTERVEGLEERLARLEGPAGPTALGPQAGAQTRTRREA
jgi:hypothetical protein